MSYTYINGHRKQAGVTSLFIVIFAALLLSVITMSFAYLMSRDLQRSSDDELSQSAYDSAMAGVEDAKRVVMLAQAGGADGARAQAAIDSGDCKTVAIALTDDDSQPETLIQTRSGVGGELNQAYTCVTISLNSKEYEGSVDRAMQSAFVPLKGVDSFSKIRIEWHSTHLSDELDFSCGQSESSLVELCRANDWGSPGSVPALLRAQLISPGDEINYTTLDQSAGGTTAFLYPKNLGDDLETNLEIGALQRYVNATATTGAPTGGNGIPEPTVCVSALGHPFDYRCQATLSLAGDGIPAGSDISLLRLTPIYSATNFRVTLLDDDDNVIEFDGVQPVVDSTGRANDLFRRVEARLSLVSEADYPEFAVDVDGSICKDFYVTQESSGQSTGSCRPGNP